MEDFKYERVIDYEDFEEIDIFELGAIIHQGIINRRCAKRHEEKRRNNGIEQGRRLEKSKIAFRIKKEFGWYKAKELTGLSIIDIIDGVSKKEDYDEY